MIAKTVGVAAGAAAGVAYVGWWAGNAIAEGIADAWDAALVEAAESIPKAVERAVTGSWGTVGWAGSCRLPGEGW